MKSEIFDRSKHVYKNDTFIEIIKDAVRFFNGTPVHVLPPVDAFFGTGVYALYYIGGLDLYKKYSELNRLAYNYPIYVGKAVPKGWRQARIVDNPENSHKSRELMNRLKEHSKSITSGSGLNLDDFMCRFVIFEGEGSDMISTLEAALIKIHRPLWNVALDGFGNHTPGNGRFQQAKSNWDVIHPGRDWAEKCMGTHLSKEIILKNIEVHLNSIG
ncbi:MAG: hypothetical protein RL368_1818 [Pseudomonadota bacterium]|jgi:hypothetical protein